MLQQLIFEIDKQDGQHLVVHFSHLLGFSLWIYWDVPWAQQPTDLGSDSSSAFSPAVGPDGQVILPRWLQFPQMGSANNNAAGGVLWLIQ